MMNNRGGGKAAILLYILVGILAIYATIKTVPPYMHYYALDDEVSQQLGLSTIDNDDVIIGDLMKKIDDLGLPIDRSGIGLIRNKDGSVEIKLSWTEEVDYGYGIKEKFPFAIDSRNRKIDR
ncbi:MAG: hypothetical protein ACYDFU_00190 [Nitrospirota bacterium]